MSSIKRVIYQPLIESEDRPIILRAPSGEGYRAHGWNLAADQLNALDITFAINEAGGDGMPPGFGSGDLPDGLTSSAPDIGYTFDLDTQGWTAVGGAAFSHQPIGGNPDGHVSGTDNTSGPVWYFRAPASLLGDREEYYGGTIAFDLWRSGGTAGVGDVFIEGGGVTLYASHASFAATTWTSFALDIEIGTFKLGSASGAIANEAQIRAVFADLDRVDIKGDLASGSDTTKLDNFVLAEGDPEPPVPSAPLVTSAFDTGIEGWAFEADVAEFRWVATGGNPGGYLEAVDRVASQIWFFVAPEKFIGDKSAFYGGSLAFELKQSLLSSQLDDNDVRLEGAGLVLVFDHSPNPSTDWTAYDIALDDAAGWRVGTLGGALATEVEMRAVLGDLDRLLIRGEFRSGADTGGIDNVVMTAGGELFDGTAAGELLVGGTGYDTLNGLGGSDTLQGNGAGDTLDGGGGTDWADYSSATTNVRADLQSPSTNTGDALGDSYVSVENLRGSGGKDEVLGNKKDNRLEGLDQNDVLNGRNGDDTLVGGGGKDKLTGGTGDDRFVLDSALAADAETLTDFSGNDEIALLGSAFGLNPGTLGAGKFALGTTAGDANDRIIYDQASGKLFFDADGTGAQAQVQIATLSNNAVLASTDFIVI